MNESQLTAQDLFINAIKLQKAKVCVFLNNGIKLQGRIEKSDHVCIILSNVTPQLVYKHSIATIVPAT